MRKIVLKIKGMTCSACSYGLERFLNKQKGVSRASVNLILSTALIEYDGVSKKDLEGYIKKAGFDSLGEFKGIEDSSIDNSDKYKLILFGILIIFVMYFSMGAMFDLPFTEIAFINLGFALIFLWYGFDILKSGVKNLIHGMPNMDSLVFFSVMFSFLYSVYGYFFKNGVHLYFEAVCMVIYFVKLGRYIEGISKDKTCGAIRKLVMITPKEAILKEASRQREVTIDEVKKGDILLCRAGDKVATDGVVKSGEAYVDESFITGESKPVLKTVGSKVIAGSISYDGAFEYEALKVGRDSLISDIVRLTVESTNFKGNIGRLADKFSGYFTFGILFIAILTFIFHFVSGFLDEAILHMVSVFVVACPCALGLAVPLVVMVASGMCAKKGVFLKSGDVLERAFSIDTVIFDKTGTLTYGKLKVFKFFNYSSYSDDYLMNIVANIEKLSSHPISRSFSVKEDLEVQEFKVLKGFGVCGKVLGKKYYLGKDKLLNEDYNYLLENGCSTIYIKEDGNIIGLIGVRDVVRDEVKEVIDEFKERGVKTVLMSGDNEASVRLVSASLGIDKVISSALPKDKADYVKKLVSLKKVMMVGDGINDAPALALATVSVSVNDGTDVAMDCSDVILMNNNIRNILDLIDISKQAYKVIKQNLFWAFIYNICMIPIAMGLFSNINMTPMVASILMVFSSLTVVLNSLRFGGVR